MFPGRPSRNPLSCGRSGNTVGRPGILPGRPCPLVSSYVLPIGSFMSGGPMLHSATERSSGVDGLEPADEVRTAIERYRDAVNRHDIEAVVAAFTDDGLIDCTPPPNGERYEGSAAISALFRQLFDSADERTFDTEELIIVGDRAVVRWRHHWVDRSGRPGHVRGVDVLRVRDGKVAEKLSYVKG
jgi:ketosteroid isomerase-like protein